MTLLYAYVLLFGTLASAVLVRVAIRMALRWGVVDRPGFQKLHRHAKPLLGGVAIYGAFVLTTWLHTVLGLLVPHSPWLQGFLPLQVVKAVEGFQAVVPQLLVICMGGLCFFFMGLLDDLRGGIPVRVRFLSQTAVAAAVVLLADARLDLPFLPVWLSAVVSVFWLVGLANALNMLDGLDGLAGGVTFIISGLLAAILIVTGQPIAAFLPIALAGAVAGFLLHNLPPARIFMGSAGSLFIGYALAVSVLYASLTTEGASPLFPYLMPVLLMAVPLFDALTVMASRALRGASIFGRDNYHIHHRLLLLGFSRKQTVAFIWLLTLASGLAAVPLLTARSVVCVMLCALTATLFAIVALMYRVRRREETGQFLLRREEVAADGRGLLVSQYLVHDHGALTHVETLVEDYGGRYEEGSSRTVARAACPPEQAEETWRKMLGDAERLVTGE